MPTKTERRTVLPAGVSPLWDQRQIETYYGVSRWQIEKWIDDGMPEEPFEGRGRRFDFDRVRAWHAERSALAATA